MTGKQTMNAFTHSCLQAQNSNSEVANFSPRGGKRERRRTQEIQSSVYFLTGLDRGNFAVTHPNLLLESYSVQGASLKPLACRT